MTHFLASVKNQQEAELACTAGADIIDLKNPAEGALGALQQHEITAIASKLKQRATVSATIGDLPPDPALILPAVEALQQTEVDIIKIGLFPGNHRTLIDGLKAHTRRRRLVAVLFADLSPDIGLLRHLANANFYGVMLDTAKKDNRGLFASLTLKQLESFIQNAFKHNLQSGLAGQLKREDIAKLSPLNPDYLGFRSALCEGNRNGHLSLNALSLLRAEIGQKHPPMMHLN